MATDVTQTQGQTEAVQPVKTSEIDWTAIEVRWQEQSAAARKLERLVLLEALRGKGVTNVEAHYDGYGDSGNVGDIALDVDREGLADAAGLDYSEADTRNVSNG